MTHIAGFEHDQRLLLPEAVDDYVDADNPVRFIDAFVDNLNLASAGFAGVDAKVMGRPGYAPGDLLKVYIYGYLNRVRSSWRLAGSVKANKYRRFSASNPAERRDRRRILAAPRIGGDVGQVEELASRMAPAQ